MDIHGCQCVQLGDFPMGRLAQPRTAHWHFTQSHRLSLLPTARRSDFAFGLCFALWRIGSLARTKSALSPHHFSLDMFTRRFSSIARYSGTRIDQSIRGLMMGSGIFHPRFNFPIHLRFARTTTGTRHQQTHRQNHPYCFLQHNQTFFKKALQCLFFISATLPNAPQWLLHHWLYPFQAAWFLFHRPKSP